MKNQAKTIEAIEILTTARNAMNKRRVNILLVLKYASNEKLSAELTKVNMELNRVSDYLLRLKQSLAGATVGSDTSCDNNSFLNAA
jgi:hypothetical protein